MTNHALAIACLNAIYCRTSIADWGKRKLKKSSGNDDDDNDNYFDYYNEQYTNDMKMIEIVTRDEMLLYRNLKDDNNDVNNLIIGWTRSASVHPHSSKFFKYIFNNYLNYLKHVVFKTQNNTIC